MELVVSYTEIQEFHQFVRRFSHQFDASTLLKWLREKTRLEWQIESVKGDDDEDKAEKVVLTDATLIDNGLVFKRIVIDDDSLLWITNLNQTKLSRVDTSEKVWHEWTFLTGVIGKLYHVEKDFFDDPTQRLRDAYLTKTQGVKIGCKFEKFINPRLATLLSHNITLAYERRGLATTLHPFSLQIKVNASPSPDRSRNLNPLQIKASISRDDFGLLVKSFDDYDDMVIDFYSQMPLHDHVRTLLDIAEISQEL